MSNFGKQFPLFFCLFLFFSTASFAGEKPTQKPAEPAPLAQKAHAPIDINLATAKQIAKAFKGFGKKRAAAIVAYREEAGKFESLQQLSQVKGISRKFVEKNIERLKASFFVEVLPSKS